MSHALTVNDLPHVHAIGGRNTGLIDLISKLRQYKMGMNDVYRLMQLVGEIGSAGTTKEKVIAALEAVKIVSTATPNTTDDKIVGTIETVLAGGMLDVLCNMIDSWLGNRSLALDSVESEVTALGGKWTNFLELAKLVIEWIRAGQGK